MAARRMSQRTWQPQLAQCHVHELLQNLNRQHSNPIGAVLLDQLHRSPFPVGLIGRVGVSSINSVMFHCYPMLASRIEHRRCLLGDRPGRE